MPLQPAAVKCSTRKIACPSGQVVDAAQSCQPGLNGAAGACTPTTCCKVWMSSCCSPVAWARRLRLRIMHAGGTATHDVRRGCSGGRLPVSATPAGFGGGLRARQDVHAIHVLPAPVMRTGLRLPLDTRLAGKSLVSIALQPDAARDRRMHAVPHIR